MKRVDDLLKYIESYSDIAVVDKRKIHKELLLIKEELEAINYSPCCKSDSEQLVCELCKKPLEKVTGIVCENTMCDRHR